MFSFSVSNLYDNYKLQENENESLNSKNNHPNIQSEIKKSQNINKKKIEELKGYEKILELKKQQQEKDEEQEKVQKQNLRIKGEGELIPQIERINLYNNNYYKTPQPVQQKQVQPQIVQPRQKQIDLNSNYYGNNGLDPSGKVKIFDTSKMRKHNIAQIAPNQFVVKGKFPGPQNFVEEVLDDFNYQDIQKSKVYHQVQQILQAEDQQQVEEFNTQINEIKQNLQLYREKMYKGDPFMSGYEDKEEIKMNQEIERLQKEKDLAFENLKSDEEYQAKRKVKEVMLLKEFEIRNKELESKKVITLDRIPRKRMLEIIDKYANEKKEIKLYDLRYKDQIDKHLEEQNQFFTENRTLDGRTVVLQNNKQYIDKQKVLFKDFDSFRKDYIQKLQKDYNKRSQVKSGLQLDIEIEQEYRKYKIQNQYKYQKGKNYPLIKHQDVYSDFDDSLQIHIKENSKTQLLNRKELVDNKNNFHYDQIFGYKSMFQSQSQNQKQSDNINDYDSNDNINDSKQFIQQQEVANQIWEGKNIKNQDSKKQQVEELNYFVKNYKIQEKRFPCKFKKVSVQEKFNFYGP